MPAIFEHRLGRLMSRAKLRQFLIRLMLFPKMSTQATLSIVYLQHNDLLSKNHSFKSYFVINQAG